MNIIKFPPNVWIKFLICSNYRSYCHKKFSIKLCCSYLSLSNLSKHLLDYHNEQIYKLSLIDKKFYWDTQVFRIKVIPLIPSHTFNFLCPWKLKTWLKKNSWQLNCWECTAASLRSNHFVQIFDESISCIIKIR